MTTTAEIPGLDLDKLLSAIDKVLQENTDLSTSVIDHITPMLVDAAESALAIPASTAASEQQAGADGLPLLPEGRSVMRLADEFGSGSTAYTAEQMRDYARATTAASVQGDTAGASIDSDPEFQRLAEYWRGEPYGTRSFLNAWAELVAHIDGRAQQGAAQAQACDAARYRFVKTMSKEMMLFWRGAYGCADEAIDAAMAAPATSKTASISMMGDSLQQGPATSGGGNG